ncbi:hypothetical protein VTK73DRAFT_9048 [Phialemonium thermophilum]|uniref:DNA repair protein rhp7 treble clef domain-containing protein n=1 Tax=Phialemonium thermophilum TaxID=223376 RepID=A0ABR3XLM3_9PEZI
MDYFPNNPQSQSALTDFLQSQNISAYRIRREAEERQRQAAEAAQQAQAANAAQGTSEPSPTNGEPTQNGTAATLRRATTRNGRRGETANAEEERKKNQAKVLEKIKNAKRKKRSGNDSDDDGELANALAERARLPGQMDNCAVCGKRFTVTPYTRAGPNGGLLCTPCGKELDKENFAAKKSAKRAKQSGSGRRKVQSNILDGTYRTGAKSLMALCIKTLAQNIDLADELGDLPPRAIDKIARELSRRRLLDSRTIKLFLQPGTDTVHVYDGANLTENDIINIFQSVPNLKDLKIRNAIQFKDTVMEYLLSRNLELEALYLHGSNLLSDEAWREFIEKKGESLRSLRVYYTDRYFGDETIALLPQYCPNLKRLKVGHNQKVTADGVRAIADISGLEHLGLQLQNEVHPDAFVSVLNRIGAGLQTLSLTSVPSADNTVLDAIHASCRSLQKLRITDSEDMTDDGFVRLFRGWENPGLVFLDLQKCRHVDASHPRHNPDRIGLCSDGFKALMAHSGKTLTSLNVHACRHISRVAFEEVFGPDKTYPELTHLEVSFCEEVTDFIVGCIFRSCPNLQNLNVFGCMKVKHARVPRGKILVGVPNAIGMVTEGDDD